MSAGQQAQSTFKAKAYRRIGQPVERHVFLFLLFWPSLLFPSGTWHLDAGFDGRWKKWCPNVEWFPPHYQSSLESLDALSMSHLESSGYMVHSSRKVFIALWIIDNRHPLRHPPFWVPVLQSFKVRQGGETLLSSIKVYWGWNSFLNLLIMTLRFQYTLFSWI